ncbi:DUF4932 domain-containing protein [Mucilaginibacter sp. PAMB04274]|uniref:DUF4932 domain-containing protein n=1 Tax=Mucilaginibacter sp. PAMB04274 TaxID=3138568 RepID=UPI0031F6AA4D
MKHFFTLLAVFTVFCSQLNGQPVKPTAGLRSPVVDQRVELISIAARLAGYEEYVNDYNKQYVADIHQFYDRYNAHPLIKFMQQIRESNGIGYDAVVGMAVHLGPAPGFKPLVAFNDSVPDRRWGSAATSMKFARLFSSFYSDTHSDQFFTSHRSVYQEAIQRFSGIYNKLDASWFTRYYATVPKGTFNIIIGLGLGGNNYGPKVIFPKGKEELYAIMGVWKFDENGKPLFEETNFLPTLIHEFNHSFINYLTLTHQKQLRPAGETIFQAVSSQMKKRAYGDWKTMLSESLVRASVIRYLKSHNTDTTVAEKQLQLERSAGFVWLGQLVDLLDAYEQNRKSYPTLESYMPEVIRFYERTAGNINRIVASYRDKLPHVVSISPFSNGEEHVSAGLTEIKISFDKPLAGGYSINLGKNGKEHYPVTKFIGYTDQNTAIILQVSLRPDFDYQFVLTGRSFKTLDGYPIEDYLVSFKTAK